MSLDDWLQSGKWASRNLPELGGAAGRAFEGLGSLFDRTRRKTKKAAEKGKEHLHDTYEKLELDERVEEVRGRVVQAREKAAMTAEKTLRFVKEKPTGRIARTGVQVKAGLTGFGAGYLFPDVEVLFLGVGGRGRWLVQSGVPVWGAERLARYILTEQGQTEAAGVGESKWHARRELYGAVAAPLLTGFSAGLGLRLVQDAISVRGLPDGWRIIVDGRAMLLERAWMLGNGIWCFAMGKDLLMITLGRSKSQALSDVLRKLREQRQDDEDAS